MSNELEKSIGVHCRFAHFSAVVACLVLIAVTTAGPEKETAAILADLDVARQVQQGWPAIKKSISDDVKKAQQGKAKYYVFGSTRIDGEDVDLEFKVDLTGLWTPFHKHLYVRKGAYVANRIARSGKTISEFNERFDWLADVSWIYVPRKPKPILSVVKLLAGGTERVVESAVNSIVTEVTPKDGKWPMDSGRGNGRHLCIAKVQTWDLLFGEFPSEAAVRPGVGVVTLRGSGSNPPPLARQAELDMHIHGTYGTQCWDRSGEKPKPLGNKFIRNIEIKIPLDGKSDRRDPLVTWGNAHGLEFSSGQPFASRYPALSRLSESYRRLDSELLVDVLEDQRFATAASNLEVAGLKVPLGLVARWGALVVLGIYIYFAIHLHVFSKHVENASKYTDWVVPWVGTYNTASAKLVTGLTAVVLPAATAVIYWSAVSFPQQWLDIVVHILAPAALLAACALVDLALWRIRRSM